MVGWGRKVKDPIFALEVLAELVARDPSWELHLIGSDFADGVAPTTQDYARRFRERVAAPDLRDHVHFVGFTRRLEDALAQCGFTLNTSHVEGWPVGLIESAASGCVPVVRDWPQVAALGGARGIYRDTPAWVTSTPAQAAARIVEFADVGTWVRESARSREAAVALCAVGTTTNEYLDVILGASRAVDAPL